MVRTDLHAARRRRCPGLPVRALLASVLLVACAPIHGVAPTRSLPATSQVWVDSTVATLSLRRKAAQLVFPRIPGGFLPVGSPAYERIRNWVAVEGVGGVIATIGPPMEAATTFNLLQADAAVPLLVTADMEHGPGQLLNGGTVLPWGLENGGATRFPPVMALGATGDERLAYELGRITAIEARAVGVHMTFAPVVDVNNNPGNPIINTRSYGADPDLVVRFATAHLRGLQDHGMLATVKHFPGHGDTDIDSHIDLPVISVDKMRADSIELKPYRAAIEAGVAAVMSAHIAFPSLTGDSLPATLSRQLMTDLLRDELGFDGLVVTDAMDMGAIVDRYGATEAPIMALKAGADVLLQVPGAQVRSVIDAIVDAVESGEIAEEQLDRSVRRVLQAKAELGLPRSRLVDLAAVPHVLASAASAEQAREAADRSITVVRDRDRLLPIRAQRVLSIVYAGDPDPFTGRTFQRGLATSLPELLTFTLRAEMSPAQADSVRRLARTADLVIFSPFIRVGAYKGDLALPPEIASLVSEFMLTRPTVVVSFGNPYLLTQLPDLGTYVLAWGQWEAPQVAAARGLTGEITMTGRLPIDLPPWHALGDGVRVDPADTDRRPASPLDAELVVPMPGSFERGFDAGMPKDVSRLIQAALLDGVAPGAAVAIGRHGRLAWLGSYGRIDFADDAAPVSDSTIYDVASLTKAVATTTAVMMLVDDGRIELDAPVSRYLPEWTGEDRAAVTIRHLLTHTSGLPTWVPLFPDLRGRHAYLRAIARMPLKEPPGTRTQYSDLGFMLLGLIVEQQSGQPLDAFLQARVFGPLGMRDTGFNPRRWADAREREDGAEGDETRERLLARIAPTEVDRTFRFTHLRGEVHDENAWAMGGVAGHAGLFSSARDLARLAQMLLYGGVYGQTRLIREETVRAFTSRQSEHSSRALGWDTPGPGGSSGDLFSAPSFGHTGFTGTSLWIDPERDLFVVLLTNRINPSRDNPRINSLRRALHDTIQRTVRD
jgi:beta-N-acetylhexosaminidase